MTYWLALSVLLFTIEQAFLGQDKYSNILYISNLHIFAISLIFYIGCTTYILGRVCYWESFINKLFSMNEYIEVENRTKFINIIDKIHSEIDKNPTNNREKIGRYFIAFKTLVYVFVCCVIISLVYLLFNCAVFHSIL